MSEIKRLGAPDSGGIGATFLRSLIWITWLAFLIAPISQLFQSKASRLHVLVVLAGAVLFVVIYLWTTWRLARLVVVTENSSQARGLMRWFPWPSIIALTLLCLALIHIDGNGWGQLFYYISACVGCVLPIAAAAAGIVVLDLVMISGVWLFAAPWSLVLPTAGLVTIIGIVVISFIHSAITSRELRAAREEIVYLAVAAERLRIARDLHDLLGHSLSLIALKSELARRLIGQAPERAQSEIGDIEEAARTALREVREAVTGYRRPTLANELHDARGLLTAAGVAYSYDIDENLLHSLPTPIEALLSWMVREGVTNVIRHSHARKCSVKGSLCMGPNGRSVQLEILDMGAGGMSGAASDQTFGTELNTSGNGLHGLAERVAALGGNFTAGAYSNGFRLAVSVPVDQMDNVDQADHIL